MTLPVVGDGALCLVDRESAVIGDVAVQGGLRFLSGGSSFKLLTVLPRELEGHMTGWGVDE